MRCGDDGFVSREAGCPFGGGTKGTRRFDHGASSVTAFQQFIAGDPEAFDAVVREFAGPAYTVAVRVLGDPAAAEEAVQEAMVRVWQRAAKFDSERGNERSWILSVVRNQAIDMLRKRARLAERSIDADPVVHEVQDPADTWGAVLQRLTRERVLLVLKELPREQREVIMLAYYGGLRPVTIAQRLRVPEGTIRSRLRIALSRLRTMLAEERQALEA